jgi:hypothetical protein
MSAEVGRYDTVSPYRQGRSHTVPHLGLAAQAVDEDRKAVTIARSSEVELHPSAIFPHGFRFMGGCSTEPGG